MPWTYSQSTGVLTRNETKQAKGYSGAKGFQNRADYEHLPNQGPIPRGSYAIGPPRNSKKTGPYALALSPADGTNTYGRSAFQIHGDNSKSDRSASSGCIILPRKVREKIVKSGDHELIVVD